MRRRTHGGPPWRSSPRRSVTSGNSASRAAARATRGTHETSTLRVRTRTGRTLRDHRLLGDERPDAAHYGQPTRLDQLGYRAPDGDPADLVGLGDIELARQATGQLARVDPGSQIVTHLRPQRRRPVAVDSIGTVTHKDHSRQALTCGDVLTGAETC